MWDTIYIENVILKTKAFEDFNKQQYFKKYGRLFRFRKKIIFCAMCLSVYEKYRNMFNVFTFIMVQAVNFKPFSRIVSK